MIITVTGKLGSGKTTLCRHFQRKGASVIDADAAGKELLQRQDVRDKLAEAFGNRILNEDGSINKDKLAELAFKSRTSLEKLNSIMHPLLRKELSKMAEKQEGIVVIDAALGNELGLHEISDFVIVVSASDEAAASRLPPEKRQNLLRRRAFQQDSRGDFHIENNGSLEEFLKEGDKVWNEVVRNARTIR
ncbi:dephospho-CoA kinase [Candidatus Woesearchaeota archaeon]|nr:MAG: dephospho-CoA kinase [Candidatus Woesearchaeota archaeon]